MTKDRSELYPKVERALKSATKQFMESKSICEENKATFMDFLTKLRADGTSEAQILSYVHRITPIAELIGNTTLKSVTKKQMEEVFAQYRSRKDYKQSSINKLVQCLKAFFRWVYDLSSQDPAPECVRWLKKEQTHTNIRPEDLWDELDVTRVVNASRSLRTKAMISVAFESGLRPGELRSLRIRDVVFNADIARIYCRGKTERKTGERVVPLIRCYNILKTYLDGHPKKHIPNQWLWSYGDKPIIEAYFRRQLKFLAKKAGINKPTHPYILRHSRLTRIYRDCSGEVARQLAGHVPGSKQPATYCHLAAEDMDNAVRSMNGYEQKQEEKPKPICKKCGAILDLGSSICGHCGLPQDSKGALEKMEYEENLMKLAKALLKKAEENPKVIDLLLEES